MSLIGFTLTLNLSLIDGLEAGSEELRKVVGFCTREQHRIRILQAYLCIVSEYLSVTLICMVALEFPSL